MSCNRYDFLFNAMVSEIGEDLIASFRKRAWVVSGCQVAYLNICVTGADAATRCSSPQNSSYRHFCKITSCIPGMQGDFLNDLCVLNTGSNTWTATSVVGELPEARSDTQVTISTALSCMFLNAVASP